MNTLLIAKKIRRSRERLGLSQKAVAERLKMSRPSYIDIEMGRILPRYDRMVALTKVLKMKLPQTHGY